MTWYEVEVKTVSSIYYLVDAKDEAEARQNWAKGDENGEFVDSEEVIEVLEYDVRFLEDKEE